MSLPPFRFAAYLGLQWRSLKSRIRIYPKPPWRLHLPRTMTGNRQHANPRSKGWTAFLVVLTLTSRSRDMAAAAKTHVIAFGKASSVPWPAGSGDHKPVPLKVRPLIVDGH